MKATEQTLNQINRFLKKVFEKFPPSEDSGLLTDIHIRVSQDSGEMMAFDDDENEITRCVVEQWIDDNDEDFYRNAAVILRRQVELQAQVIDGLGIMKPFGIVLETDEKDHVAELYLADDETIILGGDIMPGLDKELDAFLKKLLRK